MKIKKSYLVSALLLLSISVIIAGVFLSGYQTILSLIPIYSELEIQFYAVAAVLIILFFSLVYQLSFRINLRGLNADITVPKKIIILLSVLIVVFLINFDKNIYLNELFQKKLGDLGIMGFNTISYPFFAIVVFLLTLFFSGQIFLKKNFKKFSSIYFISSFILIIVVSFSIKNFNAYDYAYFAGPINDLLHGKYLLYNIPSQYGFLSIFFLSILFRFIELNLFNIVLVNSVAVTIGFCLIFILLQFIYRSRSLSLFVVLTVIFLNYIVQIETRGDFPQTNFIRFGMWILIVLLIAMQNFLNNNALKKKVEALLLFSLAISFFWVADNGVYVLLAYLFYKIFNNLQPTIIESFKKIFLEIVKPIAVISGMLIFFNILYASYLRIPINWNYYFSDAKFYISGFGLMPLPDSYLPWIMMSTYFISLIYLYTKKRFGVISKQERILSFIVFYGIFQFIYFMGRSHLNNLHHVVIPFLICFFYLLEKFILKIKEERNKLWKFSMVLLIALSLSVPFYLILLQSVFNFKGNNLVESIRIIKNKDQVEKANFGKIMEEKDFKNLINKYGNYIKSNGITIVSVEDTWYLIKLKTVNNINSNNLAYYADENDLKKLAESIITNKDKYIFISPFDENARKEVKIVYEVMNNQLDSYYKFKEKIGSLDVMEYREKSL